VYRCFILEGLLAFVRWQLGADSEIAFIQEDVNSCQENRGRGVLGASSGKNELNDWPALAAN